jgi:hypothetical protein
MSEEAEIDLRELAQDLRGLRDRETELRRYL